MARKAEPAVVRVAHGEVAYEVRIGPGLLRSLGEAVRAAGVGPRVTIITDEHVAPRHGQAAIESVRAAGLEAHCITIPAGERSKSLEQAARIYDELAARGVDRADALVALGGGVVGDLAGFVAATWHRGVPLFNCPTTTEAAVDAAVGGKCGLNLPAGKNLVGTFHPPRAILIDVDTFATLPERDFRSGLAESVKHGLIRDAALLDWHEANGAALMERDTHALVELVRRNVEIKAAVVAGDPFDTGGPDGIGRAALNFGHTVGHALEAAVGFELRHGECVGLGILAALRVGAARGITPGEFVPRVEGVLRALGLPTVVPRALDTEAIWSFILRDKKARGGRPRFLLLAGPGRLVWAEDVRAEEVRRGVA